MIIQPFNTNLFSEVRIFLKQNLEDDLQTQRMQLRRQLMESLKQENLSATPDLLDLLKIPQHSTLSLSLSHTKAYSCFAWCPKPGTIGVDIEDLSRLKESLVARVSSPSELSSAPRWDILWSCKEAVFKAFPPSKVLSSVEIFDLVPVQNDIWRFRARETQPQTLIQGSGEIRLILGHTLAFFIFNT